MTTPNDVATPKELLIALEQARIDKHNPGKHDQSSHGKKHGGGMGGAIRGAAGAVSGAVQAVKEQGVAGAAEQGKMIAGHKAEEILEKGKKSLDKGRKNVKAFLKSDDVKTASWLAKGYANAVAMPYKVGFGIAKLATKISAGLAKVVLWDLNPSVLAFKAMHGVAKAGWGTVKFMHKLATKSEMPEENEAANEDNPDVTLDDYISQSKQDFKPLLELAMSNDAMLQKATDVPDDQKKQSADTVAKIKEQFLAAGIMTQDEVNSLEQQAKQPAA